MVNRKSASKQPTEGGASRSPKPQPANKNRSANAGNPGKAPSKPPTSAIQPSSSKTHNGTSSKPPQGAKNRSLNGTKTQGTSNGGPKSQGANGLTGVFGGATPVHKASHGQSMPHAAPAKRGNAPGPNDKPQKAQGHVLAPRPNVSVKPQAPKPKKIKPFTDHPPAPIPVPRGHSQKPQNYTPTIKRSPNHQQPTNSGKNATNHSANIRTSTQHTPRQGESAKGFESPSYVSNKGPKNNPSKSTMSDWFLGPTNTPLPTKKTPSAPLAKASPPISSAGSKVTGNRLNPPGSKHNSPKRADMSAKQSPAENSLGISGWLSSWLPSVGLEPKQATTKPMQNSSKANGPVNGSRPPQTQVPNSYTSKGAESDRTSVPPRKDASGNCKVYPETRHAQGAFKNKGNVPAKRSNLDEGRSLGRNEIFVIPPKKGSPPAIKKTSPTNSNEMKATGFNAKHLSSHSSTSSGLVAQKPQPVPLAQDVLTTRLSSIQRASRPSPNSQATVPASSFGGFLNQVSSFFGWTEAAPRELPVKRVQATNKPRQPHDAAPKPLASARHLSKSSKDDDKLSKPQPAPTLSSTSSRLKHSEVRELVLPMVSIKNGPHDVQGQSGKSNTSILQTEQTPGRPSHEISSKPTRSDAEVLRGISKHTTHRAQKSTKHRSVRTLSSTVKAAKYTSVPRKKEFRVRSSSSKVLSQAPKKTLRKGLLRQYSPTLIWRSSDRPKVVSAYSTLAAPPLPSPPKNELRNKVARKTIAQNPELFKITTPIKADAFEKNLKDHPNQPFVESVVRALRKGFWPWANTSDSTLPTTYDGSRQRKAITSKDKADFIQQQRNEEVALGRWSKPFGKKLLPGMYSSPIGAVPKSTPGKFRLIIDQSCGPHALNTTIPKSQVKVKLDTIHDLGTALLAAQKKYPKRKLTLFKSDVKSAYRQLPMHPSWQIKQIVSIDGQRHVDRCNTFGNRGGGWSWNAFASLVNWIGTEKRNIPDLLGYVDDNFGWEFDGNTKYYKPYKKHLPAKQTRLLKLWDELGIPHDEEKQLSGPCLPILGYEVNANTMSIKVPDEKKAKVVRLFRDYAHPGTSYTLKELQSIGGSVNSVLCLYPHLRSGLRGLFDEMAGKEGSSTKLKVTKSVARSLSTLADYLDHAKPIPIRQRK